MEVIIRSKNIELTQHLRDYAQKKLERACRFVPALLEKEIEDKEEVGREVDRIVLEVEISKVTGDEKGRIYRTRAKMVLPQVTLKVDDTAETVKESIEEVKEELERQIKDHKGKVEDQRKKGGRKAKKMR